MTTSQELLSGALVPGRRLHIIKNCVDAVTMAPFSGRGSKGRQATGKTDIIRIFFLTPRFREISVIVPESTAPAAPGTWESLTLVSPSWPPFSFKTTQN
jgi:hypothetical protein